MPIVNPSCVLSIAGTDPSGGAGIQADIKAISATGGFATSVITALVAQNTQGVQAIYPISPEFVRQQMESVFSDIDIAAVKIGMIHDQLIMQTVAETLAQYRPQHVVIDPVMVAKSGTPLIKVNLIDALKKILLTQASLITPNIPEAECLLNQRILTLDDMCQAAKILGDSLHTNVLLKGGHADSHQASDVLYEHHQQQYTWFHQERIDTQHTHGTGCSLSSAIASYLAQQIPLIEAIARAKTYLTAAIRSGSQFSIGHGHGPVDHFYFLPCREQPS